MPTRLTKKPAKASNCAVKSHERVGHFLYAKRCRKTFDASPCYGSLTPPVFLSTGCRAMEVRRTFIAPVYEYVTVLFTWYD